MAPMFAATRINAGNALATTYGSADMVAPGLDPVVLGQYLRDMQIRLIVLAVGATPRCCGRSRAIAVQDLPSRCRQPRRQSGFFPSHPIFTPYYVVPIAMLSLWTLSFARLLQPAEMREAASVRREPASLGALPR